MAGGLNAPDGLTDRPLHVVPFRQIHHAPVAFLACFSDPDADWVVPLKTGLNRVGRDPMWGDHEKPGVRILEPRQWLIVCRAVTALVADDHSTNQSVVLPEGPSAHAGPDPLSSLGLADYAAILTNPPPGAIPLDWAGETVAELKPGDVLVTCYSAFVFGTLPQPGSA